MKSKTRRGIYAVVLDAKNNVLVLRRVLNWKGWELPKGGLDGHTEREALAEELWEEVGLRKKDYKVIGKSKVIVKFKFNAVHRKRWGYTDARYAGFVVRSKTRRVSFKNNPVQEHDKYVWVSWKEATEKLFKFTNQVTTMKKIAKEFSL